MTIKEYDVEFIDLTEEGDIFEALLRSVKARTNSKARTTFKKEMKEEFGVIEGKDYKIEHVTIREMPIGRKNAEGKDYGRYEIGYKDGKNIFFTGQIITAKTEKDAIDQFMEIEPDLIRENVRANRT